MACPRTTSEHASLRTKYLGRSTPSIRLLDWKVLSERENEIVIGTDENAAVGMCSMPVTDLKTVKNRVHLDLTSSA